MDIKLTLENKQLYPAVINLRQFSNNTDIIKFEMPDYMYETTDLSKMPCYVVCDMGGAIDEVKLETEVINDKLRITWKVTGYTTQEDGHINYLIAFKDIQNEESVLWFSYQGIIFVNSSIDADGYIAAKYPSILQQWEERMKSRDSEYQEILKEAKEQVDLAKKEVVIAKENAKKATNQATKAENEATDAKQSASKAESMKEYIEELINYEGTNTIEKEVVQARKNHISLGHRLNADYMYLESQILSSLRIKNVIPSNDFNAITDSGIYCIENQTIENVPDEERGVTTGTLIVINNDDEENLIIYQKYESATNFIYLRSYIRGAWTEWERNVVKKEFKQVENQLNGFTIWCDTQEAYDAIEVKDDRTLYFIKEQEVV